MKWTQCAPGVWRRRRRGVVDELLVTRSGDVVGFRWRGGRVEPLLPSPMRAVGRQRRELHEVASRDRALSDDAPLFGPGSVFENANLTMFRVPVQLQHVGDVKVLPPRPAANGTFDMLAALIDEMIIVPGERREVPTGWKLAVQAGFVLRAESRPDLALQHGITVLAFELDGSRVVLHNRNKTPFVVRPRSRIAIGWVAPAAQITTIEVTK